MELLFSSTKFRWWSDKFVLFFDMVIIVRHMHYFRRYSPLETLHPLVMNPYLTFKLEIIFLILSLIPLLGLWYFLAEATLLNLLLDLFAINFHITK